MASGARGGDILFLETCRLFGIEIRMILPFPPEEFILTSVAGIPTGKWEKRFWACWNAVKPDNREVLLERAEAYGYEMANARIFSVAQALSDRLVLIALWDGEGGDGAGGTGDFVEKVKAQGSELVVVDPSGR